jgi:glycine cleavage system H protein
MRIRGLEFPDDLYYHAGHMVWLRAEGDDVFALGATSLLLATAGEVLLFVPKAVGWSIERDRSVGNIETGKLVASVRTPLAGTLVGVHDRLEYGAMALNQDPYGIWLVRLRASAWALDRGNLVQAEAARAALLAQMDEHGYSGD